MRGNFITDRSGTNNPNYKHGLKNTRLFSIWTNMKSRCGNANIPSYGRYGGRGITICDEWKDFRAFYNWAISHGYEDHLTIDRIDVNGNYCPENCRWVTAKDQMRNTTRNHLVTLDDVTQPLANWCDEYQINYKTVRDRLKRGWSYADALSKPIQTKFRRVMH